MNAAYCRLFEMGYAHSVEAWAGDRLVGGLYGVSLGRMFFGESMFSRESDASKVAFVHMVAQFGRWGMPLIDCQMPTSHLASLGAREIPRADFLDQVGQLVQESAPPTPWRLDADLGLRLWVKCRYERAGVAARIHTDRVAQRAEARAPAHVARPAAQRRLHDAGVRRLGAGDRISEAPRRGVHHHDERPSIRTGGRRRLYT